jgi:hypothetical protein
MNSFDKQTQRLQPYNNDCTNNNTATHHHINKHITDITLGTLISDLRRRNIAFNTDTYVHLYKHNTVLFYPKGSKRVLDGYVVSRGLF